MGNAVVKECEEPVYCFLFKAPNLLRSHVKTCSLVIPKVINSLQEFVVSENPGNPFVVPGVLIVSLFVFGFPI